MAIALVALLVLLFWTFRLRRSKGAIGELRVEHALTERLDVPDYRIFSDLILPVHDGTTQIDHLVISRFGIFVIETKNMSGWIFGNSDQAQWTQVIFSHKSRFQNPIRQNYKHMKALQEMLRIEQHEIHGVVAFVGSAVPKSPMPPGVVWGVRSLVDYITSKRHAVFNDAELQNIVEHLSNQDLVANENSRNEHIQHIKGRLAAREYAPTCSRCGSKMVRRTNRRTGAAFHACTRYPRCRGTQSIL